MNKESDVSSAAPDVKGMVDGIKLILERQGFHFESAVLSNLLTRLSDEYGRGMCPEGLNGFTKKLVWDFAKALAEKLYIAQEKYGYSDGWAQSNWVDECREELHRHIRKGDPRDVAAYCAFLWYHEASTKHPNDVEFPR